MVIADAQAHDGHSIASGLGEVVKGAEVAQGGIHLLGHAVVNGLFRLVDIQKQYVHRGVVHFRVHLRLPLTGAAQNQLDVAAELLFHRSHNAFPENAFNRSAPDAHHQGFVLEGRCAVASCVSGGIFRVTFLGSSTRGQTQRQRQGQE